MEDVITNQCLEYFCQAGSATSNPVEDCNQTGMLCMPDCNICYDPNTPKHEITFNTIGGGSGSYELQLTLYNKRQIDSAAMMYGFEGVDIREYMNGTQIDEVNLTIESCTSSCTVTWQREHTQEPGAYQYDMTAYATEGGWHLPNPTVHNPGYCSGTVAHIVFSES
jgi:hypothetical protein